MKWVPTCKETTLLASRAMDARLPFAERLALRMHLAMCRNCARFAQQLAEMRRQFRQETAIDETAPALSPEARKRIETELQNRLGS